MRLAIALCLLVATAGVAAAKPRIVFTGNATFSAKELLAAIDDPFDAKGALVQEVFEHDLLVLAWFYWNHGYARVRIGEPTITPAEITIPITENEKFTFGAIVVDARHRGALRMKTGATFSMRLIEDDRLRIVRYYEELGHANVDVRASRTETDLATRTIGVTFEIKPGPVAYVEAVHVDCGLVHDPASVLQVFPHDRYDVRKLEESKAALMRHGGLQKREVIMAKRRGSSSSLVIVDFRCERW